MQIKTNLKLAPSWRALPDASRNRGFQNSRRNQHAIAAAVPIGKISR
jgi:hypothetical protein